MRERKRVPTFDLAPPPSSRQPIETAESLAIRELAKQVGRVADELRTMNISRRYR